MSRGPTGIVSDPCYISKGIPLRAQVLGWQLKNGMLSPFFPRAAPRMNTINLTAVKKITLGVTSIAWFISALPMAHQGGSAFTCSDELYDLGITGRPLSSYALIAYSGLGCGAAATFLQTRGQARVPPPSAQVIYSLTPLWSALIAQVALGDETLGPAAWGGGGAMLLASLLAARAQAEAQQNL